MGHVNEGGMHFIHFGKGIEKSEFEIDNSFVSNKKKKSPNQPQTVFYRGKPREVVSVKLVKRDNPKKKISPERIIECKYAIGYKRFCDKTGKEYIGVLLMHKVFNSFTLDSSHRYVLRASHSFKMVNIMAEVAIDKDHRMPIRSFAEKSFIKIEQDACWVAVCIPVPPTNGLLRSEGKYRIDYSVKIDSGIEVGFQLLVSEEEFSYAIAGREDLWKLIMGKDVEKLFSLPGFDNYCERL